MNIGSAQLFRVYIWIIDVIRRYQPISLAEINELWVKSSMSKGEPLNRNSFRRYLDAIEEMFGITVSIMQRDRTFKYSIEPSRSLHADAMQRWMLSTMCVSGAVRESVGLSDRILLENVPTGDRMLMELTRAMQHNHRLRVKYQKFVDSQPYTCVLEPLCLKLFRQRWYLLAHRTDRTYLAIYALDRIHEAEETNEKFELPRDFDAKVHFQNMFGVFQPADGQQTVRILLRTYEGEWDYMRTLPLHATQREVEQHFAMQQVGVNPETGKPIRQHVLQSVDFSLDVYPTLDLKIELLSRGSHIEVLEPQSLREEMQQRIAQMLDRYKR